MLTFSSLLQDQPGSRSCGYVEEMLPVYVTSIGQDLLCCISILSIRESSTANYHPFCFSYRLLPSRVRLGGVNFFSSLCLDLDWTLTPLNYATPNLELNHCLNASGSVTGEFIVVDFYFPGAHFTLFLAVFGSNKRLTITKPYHSIYNHFPIIDFFEKSNGDFDNELCLRLSRILP